MKKVLNSLLLSAEEVDGLLCKVLTKNDDAGRHGVHLPIESYRLFPPIKNFKPKTPINYTEDITTIWKSEKKPIHKGSKYKHYHRYPERRITKLDPSANNAPPGTIILVGRRNSKKKLYECHIIYPNNPIYFSLLEELGLSAQSGLFFLDLDWKMGEKVRRHNSLTELLNKFNEIKENGFICSKRKGDTGIGYTFENLMGINENNDSGPDFRGIEIKCFGLKEGGSNQRRNLFLKEPRWVDGLSSNDRIKAYGYFDEENKRYALYSSIKVKENSHGLRFVINEKEGELTVEYKKKPIGFYSFDIIEERLKEKLSETAYIGAKKRRVNQSEEFHYCTFTYYSNPSIKEFASLARQGKVNIELRMREDRNRGTCFRILESSLPHLYARTERIHELDKY